jgi:hypothetical protein
MSSLPRSPAPPLAAPALAVLAERVCRAVRDLRGEHEAWIAIDRLQQDLGPEPPHAVEAAVAFAGAKGWLAVRGRPADCVLLMPGAP